MKMMIENYSSFESILFVHKSYLLPEDFSQLAWWILSCVDRNI